jgi:L-fuculose-phosphate aldolase
MSESLRLELIETALLMNASGINSGTSGNLSVRHNDGMLITPSGIKYQRLSPEDIVFVDQNGEAQGSQKPSSEWRFHFDIYKSRPDAQAVLHAHPAGCAALGCLNKSIPAFHYMVAVAGGKNIRCASYATFGSQELSNNVLIALKERKACLMANHGLLCLHENLEKALDMAIEIEHLANTYLKCLAAGEPITLSDEEMSRVIEGFKTYGPSN